MDPDHHLQRIMTWCARSERCSHEVKDRLSAWGVSPSDIELYLVQLQQEKFVDDDRYLKGYVLEKWNTHHWGKLKIARGLLDKRFDELHIEAALALIEPHTYITSINSALDQKWASMPSGDHQVRIRKLALFAAGRGYEEEIVAGWLATKGVDLHS